MDGRIQARISTLQRPYQRPLDEVSGIAALCMAPAVSAAPCRYAYGGCPDMAASVRRLYLSQQQHRSSCSFMRIADSATRLLKRSSKNSVEVDLRLLLSALHSAKPGGPCASWRGAVGSWGPSILLRSGTKAWLSDGKRFTNKVGFPMYQSSRTG